MLNIATCEDSVRRELYYKTYTYARDASEEFRAREVECILFTVY